MSTYNNEELLKSSLETYGITYIPSLLESKGTLVKDSVWSIDGEYLNLCKDEDQLRFLKECFNWSPP